MLEKRTATIHAVYLHLHRWGLQVHEYLCRATYRFHAFATEQL